MTEGMVGEQQADTWETVSLLLRLGISPNMTGFQYAVMGIGSLRLMDDTRCLPVANGIYPEAARHYRVSPGAVERGLRTMLEGAWNKRPEGFGQELGIVLKRRPAAGEFLILAIYCLKRGSGR